jgi:GMP synthase (glutamine-hydrolysing)
MSARVVVMTVLVLQHVEPEGPGRIATAIEGAGHAVATARLFVGDDVPRLTDAVGGVVVMGGPMSVGDSDRYPHLADEQALLRECLEAGVPVLGVCLGAQLLAAAAGARVLPGESFELGWHPVTLSAAAATDPLFAAAPPSFTPLHWHGDVVEPPAGAAALASSEMTPLQAFRLGRTAYGLLFHLEAGHEQVQAMAEAFPGDLARAPRSHAERLLDPRPAAAISPLADDVFSRWAGLLR